MLEACKADGVDIYSYLGALFMVLPHACTADDYEALQPRRVGLATD